MRIDPRTKASRLSKKRVHELREIAIETLNRAIAMGGTTIHSFDSNSTEHTIFSFSWQGNSC